MPRHKAKNDRVRILKKMCIFALWWLRFGLVCDFFGPLVARINSDDGILYNGRYRPHAVVEY